MEQIAKTNATSEHFCVICHSSQGTFLRTPASSDTKRRTGAQILSSVRILTDAGAFLGQKHTETGGCFPA